jgi:hypothetical protein
VSRPELCAGCSAKSPDQDDTCTNKACCCDQQAIHDAGRADLAREIDEATKGAMCDELAWDKAWPIISDALARGECKHERGATSDVHTPDGTPWSCLDCGADGWLQSDGSVRMRGAASGERA